MDDAPHCPDDLGPARLVGASGGGGGSGGDLVARLERWLADARVDEAARARSRERWLRRQAEEESTIAGALADLLEAGAAVVVHTQAGGRHAGTVRAVGADFVAMAAGVGQGNEVVGQRNEVVIPLGAITSVRGRPGAPAVLGDRQVDRTMRLTDVVAALAAERDAVRLVTLDGDALTGVVCSVGQDMLVMRRVGEPPAVAYVPLDAISVVAVGD